MEIFPKKYLKPPARICSLGFNVRRKLVRASTWSAGWSRSTELGLFSQWFGARWFGLVGGLDIWDPVMKGIIVT